MNDEKNINHPKKLKLKKLTSKKVNSVVNAKTPKDSEALQVGTSSPVKPFKRKSDNCDPEPEPGAVADFLDELKELPVCHFD